MNHSENANCLRDIEVGEELTMDYSFHANPMWYQDMCRKFEILSECEINCRKVLRYCLRKSDQ